MNLQQLRYVAEVARAGFNVSDAAEALFTSQPGVSKQLKLLEEELGVDIFVRHGKRLTGITEPGRQVLAIAERVLRDIDNLKQVGAEFAREASGRLGIATTHTQARYALPPVIRKFVERYPGVQLSLHQGNPSQCCEYVLSGEADIAVATEAISEFGDLVMLPCYQWNRVVIAPPGHPILAEKPLTLEAIARHPIITYDFAFTGRSQINKAFLSRGLRPNVTLTAIDSDVIKTYVELGLGVGILNAIAFDAARDTRLAAIDAGHLFAERTTYLAVHRRAYLRTFAYDFIGMFAPALTREHVGAALAQAARGDEASAD